jgi:branched-chain amino acid aminotransferase
MSLPRTPGRGTFAADGPTTSNLRFVPAPISRVEDTGLSELWLQDLALKILYFRGYQTGFKVVTLSTRRNDPQAINPAVKSLNYLNNVMGALELRGCDVNEGLFLTTAGYVCECTADNFFLVKGHKLLTPHPSLGALKGITRGVVMRLAAFIGLEVEEGFYTLYDVYTADEAFLTGTAAEVGPVVEVDKRVIGAGVPGPVTKEITSRFHEYAQNSGAPVNP